VIGRVVWPKHVKYFFFFFFLLGFKYEKTFAHRSRGSWQTVSADVLEERVLLRKHKKALEDSHRSRRPSNVTYFAATRHSKKA